MGRPNGDSLLGWLINVASGTSLETLTGDKNNLAGRSKKKIKVFIAIHRRREGKNIHRSEKVIFGKLRQMGNKGARPGSKKKFLNGDEARPN